MNDKELYNTRLHDISLREAIVRRAQKHPQIPADLNERLMKRVEMRTPRPSVVLHWEWLAMAACMVVAFFLGFTLFECIILQPSLQASQQSSEPPKTIYASVTDTTYQDPALVDEYIAKLAAQYEVVQELPDSVAITDAGAVSFVYMFPDYKQVDVLDHMQQVACWYSNSSPGYLLHMTNDRLLFELQDATKDRQYLWIVEEIGPNTLLYGINSPLTVTISYACYTNYRERCIFIDNKSKFCNF